MTYAITKKFVSGSLTGMEHKELTGIKYTEGKQYDNYIIVSCKPVNDLTTVQMTAIAPRNHGGKKAFVSGEYSWVKECKKQWKKWGYYNFYMWVD